MYSVFWRHLISFEGEEGPKILLYAGAEQREDFTRSDLTLCFFAERDLPYVFPADSA